MPVPLPEFPLEDRPLAGRSSFYFPVQEYDQ